MKILYEVRQSHGVGGCVKPQHLLLFFCLKAKQKTTEGRQRWKVELESGEFK